MKKTQWLRLLLFLLFIIGSLFWIDRTFENKSEDAVSKNFSTDHKKQYDVIFVGPSTMKNDIYPLEIFHEYGITSYNLACGSQTIAESYYLTKSAIAKYQPKLVVLDVFMTPYEGDYLSDGALHFVTDVLSAKDRSQMVREIVPEEEQGQFLWKLSVYHERWKELEERDFTREKDYLYGAKLNKTSKAIREYEVTTETKELPDYSISYLDQIVSLCKEQNIDLMLINLPIDFAAKHGVLGDMKKVQRYYNYLQEYADQNELLYWNYMTKQSEIVFDKEKDYDGAFHLNILGAEKMSSYLGAYLSQNYSFEDKRSDPVYEYMRDDYTTFITHKEEMAKDLR